jgi:predicted ATPase/signal transduction histidine kinase
MGAGELPPVRDQSPRGDVFHQSERTRVTRIYLPGRAVIRKEPLGADAERRLKHEAAMLERLCGAEGIAQLLEAPRFPGSLVLEDAGRTTFTALAKPLPARDLFDLALKLVSAVAGMHQRGVMHRDISPANLVISEDGEVCLLDFALASSFAEIRLEFTHYSQIVGTLAYLAPEQTGRTGRAVDQRADLYAVGATLYELATGAPPFGSGDPLRLVHDHLARLPTAPAAVNAAVPEPFSDIVMHLLEKEPDNRYQSGEGVIYDLERLRSVGAGEAGETRLGEHDFPVRLLPPSRLVGRDDEVAALRNAFADATSGRSRGVLVGGPPGVGKTVLVDELRAVVTARDGWFVAGKFDQYRRDLEFDAGYQAFRGLGRLLLAEPEHELAELRERILEAVGPNAGLLSAVLPEFAVLLAVAPDRGDPLSAQARVQRASVAGLRAVASKERPVVLFVDDLQWAGHTPLGFVDLVLSEQPIEGLLLVGAYRDSEVDATHPLAAPLARWREQTGVRHLRLENLSPPGLAGMVAEMLHYDSATAAGLADVIEPYSCGNPYETVELLNALRREGLLSPTATGWRWDAGVVHEHLGRSEMPGSLAGHVETLPASSRQLVEAMACLGGRVELSLLQTASALPARAVDETLAPALEEGLLAVEPGARPAVRFRHDRIREAILRGLEPEPRAGLHLEIARRLAAVPELFAAAAEQYLPVIEAIADPAERHQVVLLLQRAADQAALIGDYLLVSALLAAALRLIDAADTATLIAVHTGRHSALYSSGRLQDADEEYHMIERLSTGALDRSDATPVQIRSLTNRTLLAEAVGLGLESLRELGIAVPAADRFAADLDHQFEYLYRWLDHSDAADDLAWPEITDPALVAATRVLEALLYTAYMVADPAMYGWLAVEAVRIWLEHGPGPALIAPACHTAFAVVAVRGDYAAAYRALRRSLALGETRGYEPGTSQARYLLSYQACWFEPIENGVDTARRAREGLVAGADLFDAGYTYYTTAYQLLDCALSLDSLVAEVETGMAFVRRTGNEQVGQLLEPCRWLVGVLRGERAAETGEALPLERDAGNPLTLFNMHFTRAVAAAVFDDPVDLGRHSEAAMALLWVTPGVYQVAVVRLLRGLALAGQARASHGDERGGLLAELDEQAGWLAARAADAPDNFLHLLRLLEAERAWAVGDFRAAAHAFDAARREVSERQRPWHRALIDERAARFYLEHGLERAGYELLAQAREGYLEWGASAKVAQLDWAYPTALATPDRLDESAAMQSGERPDRHFTVTTGTIDLLGILSASQALSSETVIDRLHARVAEVLGAMTGATGVQLLVWSEDRQAWLLATSDREGGLVPVSGSEPPGTVPTSVLRYVQRTSEPLVVGDATRDDRFARDPYFTHVECCSLLALPILSRGTLQAVLVLENRLIRGAFSTGRLDAVKLIAGQLAVSLDNAQVYAEFRRVADEQAALRRVATLVALGVPAAEVFAAVAAEVGQLVSEADVTHLGRYDDAGSIEFVGGWSREGTPEFVGDRVALGGANAATLVFERNAPARVDVVPEEGTPATMLARSWARSVAGTPINVGGRLWGVMSVGSRRPDGLPVGVELWLADFTELVATAIANADGRSQLLGARRRVIEATDAARANLARDIHDGAQQQFLTALLDLQLAQQKRASDPGRSRELVDLAVAQVQTGVETLRELAAGVHPAILSDLGLKAALEALAARMPIPLLVEVDDLELPATVEASVYFFCSEALTNIVKHAKASTASGKVEAVDGQLRVEVRDDGIGGAEIGSGGTGLIGLRDRIGALEGSMSVASPPGGAGTTLVARIPLPG